MALIYKEGMTLLVTMVYLIHRYQKGYVWIFLEDNLLNMTFNLI